jgi:hypothetical protein
MTGTWCAHRRNKKHKRFCWTYGKGHLGRSTLYGRIILKYLRVNFGSEDETERRLLHYMLTSRKAHNKYCSVEQLLCHPIMVVQQTSSVTCKFLQPPLISPRRQAVQRTSSWREMKVRWPVTYTDAGTKGTTRVSSANNWYSETCLWRNVKVPNNFTFQPDSRLTRVLYFVSTSITYSAHTSILSAVELNSFPFVTGIPCLRQIPRSRTNLLERKIILKHIKFLYILVIQYPFQHVSVH